MVAPKNLCPPEPVDVTISGRRVFADTIKLRISRRDHPGLGWALNPKTSILNKKRRGGAEKREREKKRRGETHRRPCNDRGRNWGHQGFRQPQKLEGFFPQSLQKKPILLPALILNF